MCQNLTIQPGRQTENRFSVFAGDPEATIPFLLFVPSAYQEQPTRWPLMLFLHGFGESGDGELTRVKDHGPPKLVESDPDFPCVVVSPQLPFPVDPESYDQDPDGLHKIHRAWKPSPLMELVDHVSRQLRIDRQRIYVTGLSMGGFGTWRLIAAYPDRFAAAVPVCGGGDPESASALAKVPIWAFHGARDEVVPVQRSKWSVDAVQAAGGDVKLTIYPTADHDSWTQTYANPKVYQWLLSHRTEGEAD